jgi:hypothetical protein
LNREPSLSEALELEDSLFPTVLPFAYFASASAFSMIFRNFVNGWAPLMK